MIDDRRVPHIDIQDVLGESTVSRLHELIGPRTDAVVAVATPTGELVWASDPGSQQLFGRQQVEFAGHSQYEYVHADDHSVFRRKIQQAVLGETVRYSVRAMAADGSWVHVASVAWAVTTPRGQLIVSIAVPRGTDKRSASVGERSR